MGSERIDDIVKNVNVSNGGNVPQRPLTAEEKAYMKAAERARLLAVLLPDILSLWDRLELMLKTKDDNPEFYKDFKITLSDLRETIKMYFDKYNIAVRDYVREVEKVTSKML